jgi:hypothetical protein
MPSNKNIQEGELRVGDLVGMLCVLVTSQDDIELNKPGFKTRVGDVAGNICETLPLDARSGGGRWRCACSTQLC